MKIKSLGSALLVSALLSAAVHAGLPQPDVLIYGTISLNGKAVAAQDSNFVVEARRTLNGPAVVSYRMGSVTAAGTIFYQLRLPLETSPIQIASASRVGETLFLVVRDESGVRDQRGFQIKEWGSIARVDFGPPLTDPNDIPQGWQELNLQGRSLDDDNDGDGVSNRAEYFAGTNPNSVASVFKITVTLGRQDTLVTFVANKAEGVGYENRNRYYTLEKSTGPTGPWSVVSNYSNIQGNNQVVIYGESLGKNPPSFYRARVSLSIP